MDVKDEEHCICYNFDDLKQVDYVVWYERNLVVSIVALVQDMADDSEVDEGDVEGYCEHLTPKVFKVMLVVLLHGEICHRGISREYLFLLFCLMIN